MISSYRKLQLRRAAELEMTSLYDDGVRSLNRTADTEGQQLRIDLAVEVEQAREDLFAALGSLDILRPAFEEAFETLERNLRDKQEWAIDTIRRIAQDRFTEACDALVDKEADRLILEETKDAEIGQLEDQVRELAEDLATAQDDLNSYLGTSSC